MDNAQMNTLPETNALNNTAPIDAPLVEVIIEIPRGSFLKVGSTGQVDFVSPIPCPFNYGSVPSHVGLEGDLLDALVLGPRLAAGTRVNVRSFGAVGLSDRGLYDDKLVCANSPPSRWQRQAIVAFFHFYALGKRVLNIWRRRPGLTRCEGWGEARDAIARAAPRKDNWHGPSIEF
jgi:inorganic pyrophosphatase